jgi:hypothetical protein
MLNVMSGLDSEQKAQMLDVMGDLNGADKEKLVTLMANLSEAGRAAMLNVMGGLNSNNKAQLLDALGALDLNSQEQLLKMLGAVGEAGGGAILNVLSGLNAESKQVFMNVMGRLGNTHDQNELANLLEGMTAAEREAFLSKIANMSAADIQAMMLQMRATAESNGTQLNYLLPDGAPYQRRMLAALEAIWKLYTNIQHHHDRRCPTCALHRFLRRWTGRSHKLFTWPDDMTWLNQCICNPEEWLLPDGTIVTEWSEACAKVMFADFAKMVGGVLQVHTMQVAQNTDTDKTHTTLTFCIHTLVKQTCVAIHMPPTRHTSHIDLQRLQTGGCVE